MTGVQTCALPIWTCALQVVTRAPESYRTFLAMSPEEHLTLGGE